MSSSMLRTGSLIELVYANFFFGLLLYFPLIVVEWSAYCVANLPVKYEGSNRLFGLPTPARKPSQSTGIERSVNKGQEALR